MNWAFTSSPTLSRFSFSPPPLFDPFILLGQPQYDQQQHLSTTKPYVGNQIIPLHGQVASPLVFACVTANIIMTCFLFSEDGPEPTVLPTAGDSCLSCGDQPSEFWLSLLLRWAKVPPADGLYATPISICSRAAPTDNLPCTSTVPNTGNSSAVFFFLQVRRRS